MPVGSLPTVLALLHRANSLASWSCVARLSLSITLDDVAVYGVIGLHPARTKELVVTLSRREPVFPVRELDDYAIIIVRLSTVIERPPQ